MLDIRKLEHSLLNKQLLEAELDNLLSEPKPTEMQLSIHIITARKLPISLHPKVHRQLKFCLDNQIYETKVHECEGTTQTAKWNETHLVQVNDYDTCLKIVYIESETSNKPLGGVIIKLSGLVDQKRHDGWYDIGYGEVRLAMRFMHNTQLFYQALLETLSLSVKHSEDFIQKTVSIKEEFRFDKLYSLLVSRQLKTLVDEVKKLRKFMDFAALRIQNHYIGWISSKEHMRKKFKQFNEANAEEYINETLNIREIESTERIIPFENTKQLDLRTDESVGLLILNQSEVDMPPYIEVVEKVCKRRIAIKRY